MTTKRDYYEILGIGKDANDEVIKKAYRKVALQYHPDRNPDDPEAEDKFKEATEAYEVLRDPQKRGMYDQFGHAGLKGGQGFPGGGFGFEGFDISDALRMFMNEFGGFSGGGFDDLFGFGRQRRRGRRVYRGDDIKVPLKITLEEVAEGIEKELTLKVLNKCPECAGTGVEGGGERKKCPQCNGAGEVRRVTRSFLGQMVNIQPCDYCQGTGTIVTNPCSECGGEGRVRVDKKLKVKVPGGVASGNYMTIEGKGHVGPYGGPPGNVIVFFEEEEHEVFERHGDDIITEIPISFSQAALGDNIIVPTLNDETELSVPSGTQSGKIFRLRGKGIKHLRRAGRGDELVRIVVWTPTKLDNKSREIFEELARSEGMSPPNPSKSFFKRLRESLGV